MFTVEVNEFKNSSRVLYTSNGRKVVSVDWSIMNGKRLKSGENKSLPGHSRRQQTIYCFSGFSRSRFSFPVSHHVLCSTIFTRSLGRDFAFVLFFCVFHILMSLIIEFLIWICLVADRISHPPAATTPASRIEQNSSDRWDKSEIVWGRQCCHITKKTIDKFNWIIIQCQQFQVNICNAER